MSASRSLADVLPAIVGHVRNKGVTLWAHDGQLHYRAPRGALSLREVQELRAASHQIVALLTQSDAASSRPTVEAKPQLAPLTFSQLAHWNVYRLCESPAIRQIAAAIHLRGRLQMLELSASVTEVVRRHDALRTRIELIGGVPMQQVSPIPTHSFAVVDLRNVAGDAREHAVQEWIHRLILEPIDPCMGPLFALRLLRLGKEEYVLIAVMEHMVADAHSMNLFMGELFTTYSQLVRGVML